MQNTIPKSASFSLARDSRERLVLIDRDGRRHENVRARRMFPITDTDHWIALHDEAGNVLIDIEDPGQLPEATQSLLRAELALNEFLPRIQKIIDIARAGEALDWQAETDRGPTLFRLMNADAIRPLGGGGLLLVDEHGTRYLIPDVAALDAASRRKLEWCMF